ncbi:MAG: hypothetical protein H6Q12_1533 [Bacteroidetes bacterium]|nr:hypothetical protein [Bacteroidota bacterium]
MCPHFDLDSEGQAPGIGEPFFPAGAVDGKVINSKMAKEMSFIARWGNACGTPFNAKLFLEKHPQYEWMTGVLKDRPTQPWTIFKAGESK